MPQTTLADHGGTGQQSLTPTDDDLPTTYSDDGIPRRVGDYEAVTATRSDTVARWEHRTGRREIVVMAVVTGSGTEYEVQDVRSHAERSTTHLVDESPSKSAAIAAAVRFME